MSSTLSAEGLLPFSGAQAKCSKCRSEDISLTYHAACGDPRCVRCHECPSKTRGPSTEHIHRHCRTCGFNWNEEIAS